jgi:hypothetical protein
MVTIGNATFATSLIHGTLFVLGVILLAKAPFYYSSLKCIYVFQYTFQCICNYIQVMTFDPERNILDTKNLNFASRRDMDMAIALLVGSTFTFVYNNA